MNARRVALVALLLLPAVAQAQNLRVGFSTVDITPDLKKPVYLACFGKNRVATKVHDPIMARAVILAHGEQKIAIVSVDLIGLFHDSVERVRSRIKNITYLLVNSTHNHEGPDTMGLWGPNLFTSGIDADYQKKMEAALVAAIRAADKNRQPVSAKIGSARGPELLHDGREPYVKHDELVALQFLDAQNKPAGIVVQWHCHPETLSSKNTEVSADFVGYTVAHLKKKHGCPVVPVRHRHRRLFGGGFHCFTLDTVREGGPEDYLD